MERSDLNPLTGGGVGVGNTKGGGNFLPPLYYGVKGKPSRLGRLYIYYKSR